MEEQRRSKRVKVKLSLDVGSVFKQDNIEVSNLNAPIEVTNISRTGIGFVSESVLPVGYYFNARFELKPGEAFNGVVRIIRRVVQTDGRSQYGCEFVGLASIFDYIFDDIEQTNEEI